MYRETKYSLVLDKISVLYCNMALIMTFFSRENPICIAAVCYILMLKEADHIHSDKDVLLFFQEFYVNFNFR